jgi:hypothetical protein
MQQNVKPQTADEEDRLEKPEKAPSFLTARELQVLKPAQKPAGEEDGEDAEEETE